MTAPAETKTTTCPVCGATATGRFCSECGATLGAQRCAACDTGLIEGAKFCHRCGLPAGAAAPASEKKTGPAMSLPWIVAAIALLAFIALIAGQRFGSTPSAEQVPAGDAANAAPVVSGGRAPDISQMSAAERADRLHNRILTLRQEGKQDSVMMFAPMGIAAYEMLPNLDNHARYDLGMIADASENATLARAEADTILRSAPDNLLGLILAARAAKMQNRSTDERRYYQRLVAVEKAERAKQLDEYLTHDNDITIALDEARRTIRR